MKNLKKIYNVYTYLSILFHELSHILVVYLLGSKIEKVTVKKDSLLSVSVLLELEKKEFSRTQAFLFAYSPYLVIILFGVLSFFSNFFLVLFVYTLTNAIEGLALPSKVDKHFFKTYGNAEVNVLEYECDELSIV